MARTWAGEDVKGGGGGNAGRMNRQKAPVRRVQTAVGMARERDAKARPRRAQNQIVTRQDPVLRAQRISLTLGVEPVLPVADSGIMQ